MMQLHTQEGVANILIWQVRNLKFPSRKVFGAVALGTASVASAYLAPFPTHSSSIVVGLSALAKPTLLSLHKIARPAFQR